MSDAVQGVPFPVQFALVKVVSPTEPLTGAFPGGVITPGQIVVCKNGATTGTNAAGTVVECAVHGNYTYTLTADEMALGIADGATGSVTLIVNHASAVVNQQVVISVASHGPGTLTAAQRALVVADTAAAVAVLLAALPAPPSSATIASAAAVAIGQRVAGDGRTYDQALRLAAALAANPQQWPMTPSGGPWTLYAADGVTVLAGGSIDAAGAKTVVP